MIESTRQTAMNAGRGRRAPHEKDHRDPISGEPPSWGELSPNKRRLKDGVMIAVTTMEASSASR